LKRFTVATGGPPPRLLANVDPLNRIPDIKIGISVQELLRRRPHVSVLPFDAYKEKIGGEVFVYKVSEPFYSKGTKPSAKARITNISAFHPVIAGMTPQQEWNARFAEISKTVQSEPVCVRFTRPGRGMFGAWKSPYDVISLAVFMPDAASGRNGPYEKRGSVAIGQTQRLTWPAIIWEARLHITTKGVERSIVACNSAF
jgi:hypothetical protein